MSNLKNLVKSDIAIFENAVKLAHGDEETARENLSKKNNRFR